MDTVQDVALRAQLLQRRERLETAVAQGQETSHLKRLLQEVDSALGRLENGTFGLCEVCHEPIEKDWLAADPLARICLSHLTPDQQRAFEQDLDLAAQIQAALLPKRGMSLSGWEIHYHYEPLGPVSGDYCDLLHPESDGGAFLFLLGDVSGKGVAASLLMSHLHAIFRSLSAAGLPIHRLVERANRVFCESTMATQFATLVCGRISPSGQVEICNAGHCPPFWIRENGGAIFIEATGLPVGIFCNGEYSFKSFQLEVGESLLLYTDGFSEARNPTHAEYGVARLARCAAVHQRRSAKEPIEACLKDLTEFRGGVPSEDDLTIMALRRSGS